MKTLLHVTVFIATTVLAIKLQPHGVPKEVMKKLDIKRQLASDVKQCVDQKLERVYAHPVCVKGTTEALIEDVSDYEGDEEEQDFNRAYRRFCLPECGKPALKAYEECGYFEDRPSLRDFLMDMCATNKYGEACYTLFNSALEFINNTERECYFLSRLTESCQCPRKLLPAVKEQGCCINVYHRYYEGETNEGRYKYAYRPNELYTKYCKIDLPAECNNSPIRDSLSSGKTIDPVVRTVIGTSLGVIIYAVQ